MAHMQRIHGNEDSRNERKKKEIIWKLGRVQKGTIPGSCGKEESPPPPPNLPSKVSPCPGQTSTQATPKYV